MAKYLVKAVMNDGSTKIKTVSASDSYECAECEIECEFTGVHHFESIERL